MKSTNKKILLIASIAFVIFLTIFLSIFIPGKIKKSHTCRVAFYGVPSELIEPIKSEITSVRNNNITFTELNPDTALTPWTVSSYSLIITWNGEAIHNLENKITGIPEEMLNLFPSNIAKTAVTPGGKIYAPILLDHVELDYYSSARKNASLEIPTTYAEFIAYLEKIQNEVEYPWLTNGSSDSALLDSVSVFALSYLGTDGYTQLCEELKTNFSKRKTLPHDLCIVLDEFKSLSRNKLSHRNWFVASENDIKNFMEWEQAGVISMRLSAHRKFPTNLVKNYEVNPFPPKVQEKSAIIIPELCAVILNDKNSEQEIVKHLVSQETQDSLSLVTGLAPSTLRAPAADRQADDVRFWAASNSNGIMPPIQNASFIQPAQISDLAEKIRNYLRN